MIERSEGTALTVEELSQAVRPTLFDIAAQPELLISLIYANLMSPSVWEIKTKIHDRVAVPPDQGRARTDALMLEIHEFVNKRFTHLSQRETAGIWGVLDLEEERERLSPEVVDYAVGVIMRTLENRRERGILRPGQNIFALVERGAFPAYEYLIAGLLQALARVRKRKHRPLGVTACGDEATLISALVCAGTGTPIPEITILGSPFHFTTFVRHEHHYYWFNGKREFFNTTTWAELTKGENESGIQQAFDDRIGNFERIVSVHGVHQLSTGECTIPEDELTRIYDSLSAFFGIEVRQISEARQRGITWKRCPRLSAPPLEITAKEGARDVEQAVRQMAEEHPDSIFELSLYSLRDLRVGAPEAYLEVALRGHRTRKKAGLIKSVEDAVNVARSIAGTESSLASLERLVMPDEVLRFDTGDHRERAVLLFALIHNAKEIPAEQKTDMQLVFTDNMSCVRIGDRHIDTNDFTDRAPIEDASLILP